MRFLLSLVGVSLATAQQTQKVPMPGSPQIEIAPPEGSAESTQLLGGSDGTDYDYDVTQPSSLTSSAAGSVLSQVLFALSSSDEDNSDDYDYDADIFIVADPPKSSSHSSHHSSHHSWSNDDDDDDDEDRLNEIYHSTPHHLRRQRHNHLAWQPPTLIDMLLQSKYDDDDSYSDYDYDFGVSGSSPLSLLDMLFMAPSAMTPPRVPPPPPKQPSASASFSFIFGTPQQMHDARQQTYRMFPPRAPPQQPQLTQTFFVPPPQQPQLTQTTFVPPPQQPTLTQTTFVPPSPPLTLTQTTFVPPEQQQQTTTTTPTTTTTTTTATQEISPPVPKKNNPDVATAGAEIAPAPKTNNKAPLPDTVSYRSAP